MEKDKEDAIYAILNNLTALRSDIEVRQRNLEVRFQSLATELQPCAAAFCEFQNAAERWQQTGGTLARMISEALLGSLPSRDG